MKGQSIIFSTFVPFLIFIISIGILYIFIQGIINNMYQNALIVLDRANKIYSEHIKILNNQTSYLSPYLTIQNVGYSTLDLSCFQLFVNGKLTAFNYDQRFLLPNQIGNITFQNTSLINASWNYINLITCNGIRYDYTVYAS